MPELPEVEITARLLDVATRGALVQSALAPGVNVMKTFDPPLAALEGETVMRVRRRGKHLIVDFGGGLSLLIHLMSAGRLQLWDRRGSPRDKTSRLLLRLGQARRGERGFDDVRNGVSGEGGGERRGGELELRLREFGSKQAAWARLVPTEEIERQEAIASLGPEAWPNTPELQPLLSARRPLHALLRDQHVIAGIGRSWVDEILWEAMLSPYKRGSDLDEGELMSLREAISSTLSSAMKHYERTLKLPLPDKLPLPLKVHRHEGEACERCGAKLMAVHFEDYVIAYCPDCQTGSRPLKDRRLSKLLK